MKFVVCFFLFSVSSMGAICQQNGVSVGITKPDESAVLEVQSATGTQGILIPRISDRDNIDTPANGLLIIQDENDPDGTEPAPLLSGNNMYQYNEELNQWQVICPRGGISMWSGTQVPSGWILCDGTQGTPDLRGRFIVGYDAADADYNDPGNRSEGRSSDGLRDGERLVTLTGQQTGIRSHDHDITISSHNINDPGHELGLSDPGHKHNIWTARDGGNGSISRQDADNGDFNRTTETAETGITFFEAETGITIGDHSATVQDISNTNAIEAHENRPPYYVLAFIMKL